MSKFEEIDEARRLLGLGDAATLKEIKSAYRTLAQRHHPDKHDSSIHKSDETMKRLNKAYKLLLDYCTDYKYNFRLEDIARAYPAEEDYKRWYERWSGSV